MTTETHMTRHVDALMHPASDEERTVSNLIGELGRLADRYKNDTVMLPAVNHLGLTILRLADGDLGRLDQIALDRKVHDIVERAGGNLDG